MCFNRMEKPNIFHLYAETEVYFPRTLLLKSYQNTRDDLHHICIGFQANFTICITNIAKIQTIKCKGAKDIPASLPLKYYQIIQGNRFIRLY